MKIYRYRTASLNTYRELLNKKFWFSRYSRLNDPFDGIYINNTGHGGLDEFVKSLEICCFSKTLKSLLMWAHYTDSHRGICIELEVDDEEYKASFLEVDYSKELPILDEVRTFPAEHQAAGYLHIDINKEGRIFRTKSQDWEYEEEVRIARFAKETDTEGSMCEYPGKLKAVYFGLRATNETISDINRILSDSQDIQFYQASLLNTGYQMEFTKIERDKI